MLLTAARQIVVVSVLHVGEAGDSQYDDCTVDKALQAVLGEFANYTKCIHTNTTVSVGSGVSSIDLTATSGLEYLLPDFFHHARISNADVRRVDEPFVRRRLNASLTAGRPEYIAYETPGLAWFERATDQTYNMVVNHAAPLIAWEPGTAAAVTLNIPDRFIRAPLWAGVAAYLVAGEEGGGEQSWVTIARRDYEKYREEAKAMASIDAGLTAPDPYTIAQLATSGRASRKGA